MAPEDEQELDTEIPEEGDEAELDEEEPETF